MTEIARHYLTVGTRRVHYRRAGTGPVIVLLHASPVSSEVYEPHMRIWSEQFTTITIDTPGNGLSDPLELGRQPLIEDYADALAETLAVLGVRHSACYGQHTGASIAVEFARRYPSRTAVAITDGFPLFPPEVREARLKDYLEEVTPDWTGSYLTWWWFRYREQHVFWPWHKHTGAARADQDVPDLDFLHRGVREILVAGNGYLNPYRAAFLHEGLAAVADIVKGDVPVCFGARPGDSQIGTLKRLPKDAWNKEFSRDKLEAAAEELEIFLKYPAKGTAPPAPPPAPIKGRVSTDYAVAGGMRIALREAGRSAGGVPIFLIPQVPGTTRQLEPLMRALGETHHVIAADLPGHGETDDIPQDRHSVENYAGALESLLKALGVSDVHLYGRNGGASVVAELAWRGGLKIKSAMLEGPMALSDHERQAFAPRWALPAALSWDGHHITSIWHQVRDQQLYFPWFEKTLAATRFIDPNVDPQSLHDQVVELIKRPQSYKPAWDALFAYPLRERLAAISAPVWVGAREFDVFASCLPAAARLTRTEPVALANPPETVAAEIGVFLAMVNAQ